MWPLLYTPRWKKYLQYAATGVVARGYRRRKMYLTDLLRKYLPGLNFRRSKTKRKLRLRLRADEGKLEYIPLRKLSITWLVFILFSYLCATSHLIHFLSHLLVIMRRLSCVLRELHIYIFFLSFYAGHSCENEINFTFLRILMCKYNMGAFY